VSTRSLKPVFFELVVDVIGIAIILAAGVLVYLVFRVN